jgi:hypothetical protein
MIEWAEFKYDIFDILLELLQMPQYTPRTTIKKKERKKRCLS